jgi:peptidoglycan/xylan/chitin deacetylase (PgdA/CDA1 family)
VVSSVRSLIAALAALLALAVAGCSDEPPAAPEGAKHESAANNPAPVTLSAEDKAVWRTARPTPGRIPVLLYHGVADRSEFSNQADAFYAVEPGDFAKQMALLHHAGYRAITLEQFRAFHRGEAVGLPARPILITFDDGRADARNADAVLERYGWSATMFVDVGAVHRNAAEYATWEELAAMQRSGRWSIQLHAGRGHHNIRYGAGEREVGPFYAYKDARNGETLADWHARVVDDLEWGEQQLRRHVPGYRPLAFAPPFGAYGQLDTNDPRIPKLMAQELRRRFGLVFVQQDPHLAQPGEADVTRLQLDRTITGGDLHAWLEGS